MYERLSETRLPAWTKLLPFLVSLFTYHLAYVFQISNLNPVLHVQSTLGIVMVLWWGWRAIAGIAGSTLITTLLWLYSDPTFVYHPLYTVPELLEILFAWSLIKDRFKEELWNPAPRPISKFVIYGFVIPALVQAPISHGLFYFIGAETRNQALALGAREFLGDILGGLTISLPLLLIITPWLQQRRWSLFAIQGFPKGWIQDFNLKSKIFFALCLAVILLMSLLLPLRQTWYALAIVMLLYSVIGGMQATMLLNAWVTLWYIAAPALRGETYIPDIESIQGTATLVALTFSSLLAGSAVTSLTEKVRVLRQTETDLKNARDQAQEASRAKSEFLARMSHEIRTPLNSVLGMLELLKETHLTKEQERYISLFSHAGENLKALINDLLDFSKIEAKAVAVENVSFNIHSTLRSVFELLQIKAEEKGLTFELEIDPKIPLYQMGDPTRFRQILFNLIGNALKFTTEGEVRVHMHLSAQDPRWLIIEIKDTGIGIPREKQSRIFNPFFQADTSTTRKYGGTGLGLVISKNLIEIMGGFLELKSLKGRGTTFRVSLPHRPDLTPQQEAKSQLLTPLLAWPAGKRYKLLLVDDSEDNRILLIHYLKDQPFDCEEAANGQEAYDKARQAHFDVIFMDIQMPIMSGYKSTELIRHDEKTHHKTPSHIIALTATAVVEDLQKTIESGCDSYLVKPVKKKEILEALKKHLLISESMQNIPLSAAASDLHNKDTL
ncbi:Autoinducer 2 sensor kinase/phosphatase LuxQ [compost metagenome]